MGDHRDTRHHIFAFFVATSILIRYMGDKMALRPERVSHKSLLVAVLLITGCGGSTQIPTSYVTYNSKGGTFQCEVPAGWEAKGGGKRGPEWAKITSGNAVIHVKAGLVGSLVNDIGGGSSVDGGNFPQLEPVHVVHVKYAELAAEEYDQYSELPGSPIIHSCPLGPARLSEFTAANAMGVALHGYRASIMGLNKMLTVYCVCLESDWQVLKPSFDKTLATMKRGADG